jgi:WD40 repeat protein
MPSSHRIPPSCHWFSLLAGAVIASAGGLAQEAPGKATQAYARAIAQAQADLDAGRTAEARQRLDATDRALRSFEYDYLLARGAAPKGAAPDLVREIAWPKVETRYGVLNEVDRQVAFICRDGGVRVHDLNAPDAPPKSAAHEKGGAIWSGAFSRDGKTFAAGYENGDVVVWDAKTWKVRHTVSLGAKWPVRELAVAPDGSAFVAETQAELELWSLAGEVPKKVAGVGQRYNFGEGLAFSPKGDLIATGGMFDIILHDAKTGQKMNSMRHASYTMGLEFSPDGKRIASAPRANVNKFLAVFDVADGKQVFNAGPFEQYVAGLAFTPDGKRVAATGPQKDVRLFDVATGEVVLTLKRPDHTAKPGVSRDGRVLGWSEPGGYRFIDLGKKPDGK